MIKSFEEWIKEEFEDSEWDEGWGRCDVESAYDAGIAEASAHFEEEKIKIHEYYHTQLYKLMGTEEKIPSHENNGKLT